MGFLSPFATYLEQAEAERGQRNALGIAKRDKHYASRTLAAIRRADFETYKQNIRPIEDRLIWMYKNPEQRANAVQASRDAVARSYRASGEQLQQRFAGQGLRLSPAQQTAIQRRQDLSQGLADVNAANQATRAVDARDSRILGGGSAQRYGGGAQ
ncbi:hypothetical protein D0B54_17915 [Solimonas sp. K1W22B-7]|uniref:hypothetical protein n=1 Tax=Solimonas sp. K1W22B-7 TaxID=2303331 RepID=UPI000E331FA0|nr:hypothetical protein [Solimonas sp. K1W22B-7]AXQ30437.1 hypothetical protein D0B54_17915 [Solimonas sp. K1W22B-7]